MSVGTQPSAHGTLSYQHERVFAHPARRGYVRDEINGHYHHGRAGLLLHTQAVRAPRQQQVLAWLRDHVDHRLPRVWYRLVLGHDLHIATYARLFVQHYHATQPDPFTGKRGWLENVGLVSEDKVTTAFRDFETAQLVAESSLYGDFMYHEAGTSATAEANTQTALITPSGVARVAGTQVNVGSGVYRSVATITAAGSQTWQEHGIFNALTTGTMMDRSLISPTVAVVASDTVTFTYEITKSAEA